MSAEVLRIVVLAEATGPRWEACMTIYREAFPEWERESEAVIAERLALGRYLLIVAQREERVLGFYILELNPSRHYVMFNFLAVDAARRGEGVGTRL